MTDPKPQNQKLSAAIPTSKKRIVRVSPFRFERLAKISKHQVEIEEALRAYLPFSAYENPPQKSLADFLSKQFNVQCRVEFDRTEVTTWESIVSSVPEYFLGAILGLQPHDSKVLLWLDSELGIALIDRVLGGEGNVVDELRGLTAIEEGVFQYLLLKTLREFHQAMEDFNPVEFRLERTLKTQKELLALNLPSSPVVTVKLRIRVGASSGFFLLVFPHPFIEGVFLPRSAIDQKNPNMLIYSMKQFDRISQLRAAIWVELGSVSLTLEEKGQLEKGDVILFDHTQCQMIDDHLMGHAILRVGEGKSGGLLVQIVSAEAPILLKILNYIEESTHV